MKDFKPRLITGLGILSILVLFFGLRQVDVIFFDAFIGLIAIIATAEVSRVYIRSKRYNFMNIVVFYPVLFLFLQNFLRYLDSTLAELFLFHGLLLVSLFLVSLIISFYQGKRFAFDFKNASMFATVKSLRTLFIMIYPGLLISILFIVNNIDFFVTAYSEYDLSLGLLSLILIFFVSIAVDSAAYIVGNVFKGKKLAPLISPNKTFSGSVGGFLGGILSSILIYFIFAETLNYSTVFESLNIVWIHFAVYGILASFFAQTGDIFASVIKRNARAKDFSSIFPAHGGVMDRLDSISFNSLFTLIFMLIFLI